MKDDDETGNPEEKQLLEHGMEIEVQDKDSAELLEDPQVVEQLNQVAFYNAMKKENKRFCAHCQMFKVQKLIFVSKNSSSHLANKSTSL